jgi:hypothetical protein
VSKNWPNDPIIDCKSPSNLVEVIEKDFWKKSYRSLNVFLNKMNLWTYKMLEEEFICFSLFLTFCN